MNFLGVTGLQEIIQDNVRETVRALSNADIKMWMFTGDRVENGTQVAQAVGLVKMSHRMFFICNELNKANIQEKFLKYQKQIRNSALVVDGSCLDVILEDEYMVEQFFKLALRAPGFCLCRCTPN